MFVYFASCKAITLAGCRKIEHKSIHGSVVTPLSCYTSPIICPRYNQTNQFQRNKSLEVHMECIWDKQFHHFKLFANSKTQFWCFPAAGLSNSIWCWQYRRFNLWYCCHQIVWSALWVVHCFHRSHIFFLDFTQFWSHLVLTQFWCNFASQKPIFKFASLWCAVQSFELEYWKKINISIFSSDEDFHFPWLKNSFKV